MAVLVTGGSGFIGSHLVDKLRERNIKVRIFDMLYPTFCSDVEFYKGSLLNLQELRAAMMGVDIVFHLAAVADVKDVYEEPHYSESINTRGTINVLEAARHSKVEKVIYGSTVWVYSDVDSDLIDETTPLQPPSHLYTATKIASEHYCRAYHQLYGLNYTILRYGVPYGPRARDGAVIPIFVDKALRGEPLTIAGDGSQYRDFVYVEDLAEGNVLAMRSIADNQIYNLEGSERITIKQIAETVQRIIGDVEIVYTEGRPGDYAGQTISAKKAKDELGWEPKVSFEEGLKQYIQWYIEKKEREAEQLRLERREE
jgi:UDP-glucose 4-epimerase